MDSAVWFGRGAHTGVSITHQVITMTLALTPLISLIAGILILLVPRLLNYIVAIYLIVIGLVGIFGTGNFNLRF
jgi:hypothetical protein